MATHANMGGPSGLPLNLLSQAIPMLTRHELERLAERLIDAMDNYDGEADSEDGNDLEDDFVLSERAHGCETGPGCRIADAGGQCDEDGINCGTGVLTMHGTTYHGPGCPISDPDADQLPS